MVWVGGFWGVVCFNGVVLGCLILCWLGMCGGSLGGGGGLRWLVVSPLVGGTRMYVGYEEVGIDGWWCCLVVGGDWYCVCCWGFWEGAVGCCAVWLCCCCCCLVVGFV